jgi:GNAT superfamily N-acetyltransferase
MFRPAVAGDAEAIVRLMRSYYAEEGYPFAEGDARAALARLLGEPALGRVWVAEVAGVPAAYVVLTLGYSMEYGGRDAFVDDLYVAPGERGRGLGSAALALAEATCGELGVRALHLEVERHKAPARALYRRRGFAEHERQLMTKLLGVPA